MEIANNIFYLIIDNVINWNFRDTINLEDMIVLGRIIINFNKNIPRNIYQNL